MKIFHLRLARKTLGIFLLIFILLMAAILLTQHYSLDSMTEQTQNYYGNVVDVLSRTIDDNLQQMSTLAIALAADKNLIAEYQSDSGAETLYRFFLSNHSLIRYYSKQLMIPNVISVYMIGKNRIYTSTDRYFAMTEWTDPTPYHQDGQFNRWFLRSKHTWATCLGCDNPEHYTQVLSYFSRNAGTDFTVGVDIDRSVMVSYLNSMTVLGQGAVFLILPGGDILMSREDDQYQEAHAALVEGLTRVKVDDEYYQVIYSGKTNSRVTMGVLFNENILSAPFRLSRTLLLVIVFLSMMMIVLYTFLSYKNLFQPLERIKDALASFQKGRFDVRVDENPRDELGVIYTQFNTMAQNIDHLVNEVFVRDLQNQKSELRFLQSQINPHFLFNCLNLIYQSSMAGRTDVTADMALYLGRYYRFSISREQEEIALRSELDNIDNYMKVCRLIYDHRIAYSVKVPEEWYDLQVLRLSIQPLVENAVEHVLSNTTKTVHIWLESEETDTLRILKVMNDRSTLTPEEAEKINSLLDKREQLQNGYGLANTHQRLRLHYKAQAGLEIRVQGDITAVWVKLPKEGQSE